MIIGTYLSVNDGEQRLVGHVPIELLLIIFVVQVFGPQWMPLGVDTSSCRTKWIRPPRSLKNDACVVW